MQLLLLLLFLSVSVQLLCVAGQPFTVLFQNQIPFDAVVDNAGHVYVATGPGSAITEYTSSGDRLATFNSTTSRTLQLPDPSTPLLDFVALAFAPNGQLWAVDGFNLRLFDFGGASSSPLTSSQVAIVGPTSEAYAIAFQPNVTTNDPWLLFPGDASPVQQLSGVSGAVLQTLDTASTNLSQAAITALSLDAAGNVYVAAAYPSYAFFFNSEVDGYLYNPGAIETVTIVKFSPNGSIVYSADVTDSVVAASYITGLAVSPSGDDIYVCSLKGLLHLSGVDGSQLHSSLMTDYPAFISIALSPVTGDLVVASQNAVIADFSATDLFLQSSFRTNTTAAQIEPLIVAASPTGVVYTLNNPPAAIEAFAADGTDLGAYYPNNDPTVTASFTSIITDAAGNVYLPTYTNTSTGQGVVQKVSPTGAVLQVFDDPPYQLYFTVYNLLAVSWTDGMVAVRNTGPGGANCTIVLFASDGSVVSRFQSLTNTCRQGGFTSANNFVYVDPSYNGGSVVELSVTGALLSSFNYSEPWTPYWLSVSPDDRIFVADVLTQVIEFNLQGDVLSIPVQASSNLVPVTISYSPTSSLLYVVSLTLGGVVVFPAAAPVSSGVLGDPQFVGLRGQSFQVHGLDGAIYALLSSPTTHMNGRFVFLDSGVCPSAAVITTPCWSHPGSYIGAVSVQEVVVDVDGVQQVQRLLIESGPASLGFTSIVHNGRSLSVGESVSTGQFSVQLVSSHRVTVHTAQLLLTFDNSDRFINQQVAPTLPVHRITAHGLLGQTANGRLYSKNAIKHIEGEVDDYVVADDDMFSTDFAYNQFEQ